MYTTPACGVVSTPSTSYGGGNGSPVGLWECNGGLTEQWYLYWNTQYPRYVLRNARTRRPLDYPGSSGDALAGNTKPGTITPAAGSFCG
jgi:hypothetical protein